MWGFLASVLWEVISHNDFQIPRVLWAMISSGSAN